MSAEVEIKRFFCISRGHTIDESRDLLDEMP